MATWLTFAGIIVLVEADDGVAENDVADASRRLFMERVQAQDISQFDVGIGEIQLLADAVVSAADYEKGRCAK